MRTVLIIVVIISLCFNIFFIVGYTRTRATLKKLRTPEGRMELMAKRLGMTAEQKSEIASMAEDLKKEGERMKKLHSEPIDIFWEEMLREKPDPEKIRLLLDRTASVQREARALKVDYLVKVLRKLTPDQRKEYVEMIRKKNLLQE